MKETEEVRQTENTGFTNNFKFCMKRQTKHRKPTNS